MPLPENPETREEMYLNRMAGGPGALPKPITRKEQYLDIIARYGQGGEEQVITDLRRSTVTSLDSTPLAVGTIVEAVGNPVYVDDVTQHSDFGLVDTGWYIFARITAKDGIEVGANTTVQGSAGYKATAGNNYVDVACKFEVAAFSCVVVVNWDGTNTETFVFKATDLAVNNLDYRVTFYVYDIEDPDHNCATWEYALTTDTTFSADKYYYTKDENDVYTLAEVTAGETVPTVYYEDLYTLTADETFATGKTYYTLADGVYTAATVTTGEAVPGDTYYEHSYVLTSDVAFVDGKTYYTKSGTTYTAATVTAGEAVPTDAYYNHSKVTFSGMTRNIVYVCNTPIDCPQVYNLPEIEDDTHGCWFEIRLRHTGSFSSTLNVPEGVKVATEHTQAETKGMNMVDLHYTSVGGTKLWRFLNTHSTIPA